MRMQLKEELETDGLSDDDSDNQIQKKRMGSDQFELVIAWKKIYKEAGRKEDEMPNSNFGAFASYFAQQYSERDTLK